MPKSRTTHRFEEFPLAVIPGEGGRRVEIGGLADISVTVEYFVHDDWKIVGIDLHGSETLEPGRWDREGNRYTPAVARPVEAALEPSSLMFKALAHEVETHHRDVIAEAIEADYQAALENQRDTYVDHKIDDWKASRYRPAAE